jgi:hypothetical protein
MPHLLRLAAMFFVLVAIGCSSQRASTGFKADEVPGTWSLTDDENCTFDVRLSATGGAVSNWSKGPTSAQGESGRWAVEGDRIVIDYTDGWRDVIRHSTTGKFQKASYAPGTPRDGAPSNSGLAVRTGEKLSQWVGVYELPRPASAETRSFFMSLQSTHAAWKSVNEIRVGSWWAAGDSVRVRWADGWINELTQVGANIEVRGWLPGTPLDANGAPVGAPTITGKARRVE